MTRPKIEKGWDYHEAANLASQLEALLARHGISISPGSQLEQHIKDVRGLVEQKRANSSQRASDDVRAQYRTLIGFYELASLLVAVEDHPQFASFAPHLALLTRGAALQNTPSTATDQATNKIFELHMGAVALQCGHDIDLDDPDRPDGTNPDVLFTVDGRRWGIACKVLHGKNPEGFITHLNKGLDQIEVSPADVGVVAFNLKNILPHDDIWPLAPLDGLEGNELATGVWEQFQAPYHILLDAMEQLGAELVSYLPDDYLITRVSDRKSIPAFILWGASPSAVKVKGHPAPTSVRVMLVKNVEPITSEDERVLACLNWAIYAGSPSRGERPC